MSSMVVGRAAASWRRSLLAPVGACLRRAGAQGVKGTCGPGIRRALGAAHSIPTSPSSRSAYLPTYLPRAYVSRFFFRAAALPLPRPPPLRPPSSPPRVASARSNSPCASSPVSSNSLSSLEPRLLFENFAVYVLHRGPNPRRVRLCTSPLEETFSEIEISGDFSFAYYPFSRTLSGIDTLRRRKYIFDYFYCASSRTPCD